jgi:hypothetical protein
VITPWWVIALLTAYGVWRFAKDFRYVADEFIDWLGRRNAWRECRCEDCRWRRKVRCMGLHPALEHEDFRLMVDQDGARVIFRTRAGQVVHLCHKDELPSYLRQLVT